MTFNYRLCLHEYRVLFNLIRTRSSFQLLCLVCSFNLIFFIIIYNRLIVTGSSSSIRPSISLKNIIKLDPSAANLCFIPSFDPWDQTISKSLQIEPLFNCSKNTTNLINVINSTQLVINQTVNRTVFSNSITHCVYLKIDRNPEEQFFRDWSYTLSEPILITNGTTNPILDVDFVLTRCYNNRTGFFNGDQFCGYDCINRTTSDQTVKQLNHSLVYEYVHPLIHLKKSKSHLSHSSSPSVLILMFDAVSNLQAHRALPKTLSYLKSIGLYIFERHSVVGDGTFENIVPMLFGESAVSLQIPNVNDSRYEFVTTEIVTDPKTKRSTEVKKIVHYPGPFDNYSFIVKNFSKLNYTTFFSEEWRESAFYNLKNGFRQSPTDFYLRPYWLSLYETLSYNKFPGNSNPKPCYLDKLLHFLSLNWLKEFLNVHHKRANYPTFGIMKINEMSHDYLERLFWIDNDLEKFFRELVDDKLLDNTILIFAGDHGHRQHRLRLTRIGSFEVKLPFFSVLLPQTFKRMFPQAVKNIQNNQQKLTSWWDVYETLVNILKMVEEPNPFDPLAVDWHRKTSGISLLHSIPERNCSSAGIPEKYCPCARTKALDINLTIVRELSLASINYINNVKLKNHHHLCMLLSLKTIIRAEVEELQQSRLNNNQTIASNFTRLFTILFDVSPSNAIFESSLLYDETKKQFKMHSEILRINLYGQTSKCIRDQYELRSFCYCISYYKQNQHILLKRRHLPSRR